MANQKISQLPSGTNAQAGDLFVIARGGANLALTTAQLFNAPSVAATFASLAVSGNGVLQTINGSASAFTDYRIGGVSQARVGTQNFATGDLSLLTLASAPVVFGTNNTERMRLDASGNLGLGVTPSAWATANGQRALQITQLTSLWTGANGGATFGFNVFESGVNAYTYTTNNPATMYQQTSQHRWFVASSGTAGNPITFGDPKMTLDANGNLGVGTTSAEALLHLNKAASGGEGAFIFVENSAASALGNKAGIRFATNVGASFSNYGSFIEAVNTNQNDGSEALTFGTFSGSSRAERARIKPAGQFRFVPLAAAPTVNVEDGDVYYDSGTNKLRVRAGGAWVDLH